MGIWQQCRDGAGQAARYEAARYRRHAAAKLGEDARLLRLDVVAGFLNLRLSAAVWQALSARFWGKGD